MPPKKAATDEPSESPEPGSVRKRSRGLSEASHDTAPAKRQRSSTPKEALAQNEDVAEEIIVANGAEEYIENGVNGESLGSIEVEVQPLPVEEPAKVTPRKRGRPRKHPLPENGTPTKVISTPKFTTPVKNTDPLTMPTPKRQAMDRSAQRKSARALIEHAAADDSSDDEPEDEILARAIYGDSDAEDGESEAPSGLDGDASGTDVATDAATDEAGTPSKRKRQQRKRAKSPTPPRDLPPHERYFFQNKPGRAQTSNNTLANLALLTHEEYFSVLGEYENPHGADIEYLETLHAESFPQWTFELSQGFSVCLYGFGSKRNLLHKFATHLSRRKGDKPHKVVVVNGYAPTANIREILSCIGSAVDPAHRIPTSLPTTMVQSITSHLAATDLTLTIAVNSIDGPHLRKPATQAILAQLAAHPQISLVCSADSPDFALLWDIGVRSAFNFAFHDCTTFAPFFVELDVVDDVHELLGRKDRRVNGREGVAFVLKSLPDNAKNLFRLLVTEVLVAMEEEGAAPDDNTGVEYRMVYNKAVEEFICSSEMAFRTLLKEFHDHQIITSHKDAIGTELLSVPFRKDELETILEDLTA